MLSRLLGGREGDIDQAFLMVDECYPAIALLRDKPSYSNYTYLPT